MGRHANGCSNQITIAIVGNPNCGKTTLFNLLTGAKQKTGNWAGVTVDKKVGCYMYRDWEITVVDLPGNYSLDVGIGNLAIDEKIARDYILTKQADLIINLIDASNLERNLYLTTQLLEMRCPMITVLNMMDVAKERGVNIDFQNLQQALGCSVVPIVASRKKSTVFNQLNETILGFFKQNSGLPLDVRYSVFLEQYIAAMSLCLEEVAHQKQISTRWLAIKLMEGDVTLESILNTTQMECLLKERQQLEHEKNEDADIIIADERYCFINTLVKKVVQRPKKLNRRLSDKIDAVVLNRYLGIPIFLGVMYCMFTFAIKVGKIFQDAMQQLFEVVFVRGLGHVLEGLNAPFWVTAAATGAGEGVATVANFVPLIAALFLFLSFLEGTGYMARAAFVVDRLMQKIGLPGKSFVPLIVGFGCNVPAIMATRTLQKERDRKLSIMMNPFMSCGARLQVFSLLAVVCFPSQGQNVVFLLYMIGIVIAIFTGWIMKKTLLKGRMSWFIMELPRYHWPTARVTFMHTWDKLKSFVVRAGKTIVLLVMVITILNTVGRDGSIGNENTKDSVLAVAARYVTPFFAPMGMQQDNWPAVVGIFTGILAKETVAGTLCAIYGEMHAETIKKQQQEHGAPYSFWQDVAAAFKTIPENMLFWMKNVNQPLKQSAVDEVNVKTQNIIRDLFGGAVAVFAYMLFILLYIPCVSVMGAIKREVGWRWMVFSVFWTTYLAYTVAVLFYQFATLALHPVTSLMWTGGLLLGVFIVIMILRFWGVFMDEKQSINKKCFFSNGNVYAQ